MAKGPLVGPFRYFGPTPEEIAPMYPLVQALCVAAWGYGIGETPPIAREIPP